MDYKKVHGEILKYVFEKCTINRTEFAKEISVEYSTLTQYLRGNRLPRNADKLYQSLEQKIAKQSNDIIQEDMIKAIIEIVPYFRDYAMYDVGQFVVYVLNSCRAANKKLPLPTPRTYDSVNRIQVVAFDFDGTLAKNYSNKTTWETIWVALGYDIIECQKLHKEYELGNFDHQTWCDKTAEYFKAKQLHIKTLKEIALNINLLDGVTATFEKLKAKGIKIHIVSGSIKDIILQVLNSRQEYISDTQANEFIFDENGYLEKIIGTKYDFEGKAKYIIEWSERYKISPKDILFVGNSRNDEYVHKTGAHTLCINPRLTNQAIKTVWDDYIENCSSLEEILPYLDTLVHAQ